ncbi:MAG TPA: hypothetical protein VNO30_43390 [Kofleriaceae bacterium]|nr:hypothetical protein [Kofleriaceae bacterium]
MIALYLPLAACGIEASSDEPIDESELDDNLEEADATLAEEEADATLPEVDTELGGDEDYLEEADAAPAASSMTYATANIGRDYGQRTQKMESAISNIGRVVGRKSGPKFIGWQEIAELDDCGDDCEIDAIQKRFKPENGWETNRPLGRRPDGHWELVKVPITSEGANDNSSTRAVFASPGWGGVSFTRFITIARYPSRNVTVLNTHFIFGAWTCERGALRRDYKKRRDYWFRAWNTLKDVVANEHDKEHNVIVTGDLNRPPERTRCNKPWFPTSLHGRSRVVGGKGIDYIFAVPAKGQRFAISGQGSIGLHIDNHKAHWVTGRFVER